MAWWNTMWSRVTLTIKEFITIIAECPEVFYSYFFSLDFSLIIEQSCFLLFIVTHSQNKVLLRRKKMQLVIFTRNHKEQHNLSWRLSCGRKLNFYCPLYCFIKFLWKIYYKNNQQNKLSELQTINQAVLTTMLQKIY